MNDCFIALLSLDKELVKLAEKHAREREQREREKHERDAAQASKTTTTSSNNQIQVKPIIETKSSTQQLRQSRNSNVKMSNGDHNMNTTEDLLRLIISTINLIINSLFFKIYTTT